MYRDLVKREVSHGIAQSLKTYARNLVKVGRQSGRKNGTIIK